MKTAMIGPVLFFLTAGTALPGDREFDSLVRGVEAEYGVKRLHIPLFGLANFFVKVVRPAGTSDLKLAVFENLGGRGPISDERFDSMLGGSMLGNSGAQGWKPFVSVRSRRARERVRIYSRPANRKWDLLVATFERDEAVLVQVRLNPDALAKWVDNPIRQSKCRGGVNCYSD